MDKSLLPRPRSSIPRPLEVGDNPPHREQQSHPPFDREYPEPDEK